jgi:hypothetical protein
MAQRGLVSIELPMWGRVIDVTMMFRGSLLTTPVGQ